MNQVNMQTAINKFNDLMEMIGHEYTTIGTVWSEGTEDWNLRDMVAECDYILGCYYEEGHCNGEMRYSDDPEERKMWASETGKFKRFIKRYEPFIKDMVCAGGHCSSYDNN